MEKAAVAHMLNLTQPHLIFCETKVYDLIANVLAELKIEAKIFTFNGRKGDSISVENLFFETGLEESFM